MKISFLIALFFILCALGSSKYLQKDEKKTKQPLNIWKTSIGKSKAKHGKILSEKNHIDLSINEEVDATKKLAQLLKCIHSTIKHPDHVESSVLANVQECPCPVRTQTQHSNKILSETPYSNRDEENEQEELSENPCSQFEGGNGKNSEKLRAIIDEILMTLDNVERQKATVEELRDKLLLQ